MKADKEMTKNLVKGTSCDKDDAPRHGYSFNNFQLL